MGYAFGHRCLPDVHMRLLQIYLCLWIGRNIIPKYARITFLKVKIKLFGYRGPICILPEMEKEFVFQGHEIVEENPDIIYDNNGFFETAIEYSTKYPKAKKIFNL